MLYIEPAAKTDVHRMYCTNTITNSQRSWFDNMDNGIPLMFQRANGAT